MRSWLMRVAESMMKNRSRLPQWMQRLMESAARNPDGLVGIIVGKALDNGAVPVTTVPNADLRVYIAPTNYAGQGYLWARALERSDPRILARNMAVELPGGFTFPSDTLVPIATVNASAQWAEREWDAARRFTHVLVEAERSMFGKRFGRNLESEVVALETQGVSVAFLCHGTDVRDPDRHATLTPWSPYPEDPRTDRLRADARNNLEFLHRMNGPIFISTPDLANDLPGAYWCPVIVDSERFETDVPILTKRQVRIIHASSNAVQKGSHWIEPAVAGLVSQGRIEYELISGTSASSMPEIFAGADIVLDQFRLGSYGAAACEAMASGRVVVGHVLPQVRERVEKDTGLVLPIVEATPDNLASVITGLIDDPDRARSLAAMGPSFVARAHSGSASANALRRNWINL